MNEYKHRIKRHWPTAAAIVIHVLLFADVALTVGSYQDLMLISCAVLLAAFFVVLTAACRKRYIPLITVIVYALCTVIQLVLYKIVFDINALSFGSGLAMMLYIIMLALSCAVPVIVNAVKLALHMIAKRHENREERP